MAGTNDLGEENGVGDKGAVRGKDGEGWKDGVRTETMASGGSKERGKTGLYSHIAAAARVM